VHAHPEPARLAFETAFGEERFVDRGLLTAIQAIEGYHRAADPVPAKERSAFASERKKAQALASAHGLTRPVIAGPYGYEPTLNERISDLLDRQVPSVGEQNGNGPTATGSLNV
jgi:hypothetical protein